MAAVKKYYAVRRGRQTGIMETWDACKKAIFHYPNAEYKSFLMLEEAQAYLQPSAPSLPEDTLTAWVDGSFMGGRRYGWGCVLVDHGQEIKLKGTGDDPELALMRNVAGELEASMNAMTYALEHGHTALVICHDYAGIAAWCTGGWQANKPGTQAYLAFYQQMLEKGLKVEFRKVTGHSGDHYNDMADELAKSALTESSRR